MTTLTPTEMSNKIFAVLEEFNSKIKHHKENAEYFAAKYLEEDKKNLELRCEREVLVKDGLKCYDDICELKEQLSQCNKDVIERHNKFCAKEREVWDLQKELSEVHDKLAVMNKDLHNMADQRDAEIRGKKLVEQDLDTMAADFLKALDENKLLRETCGRLEVYAGEIEEKIKKVEANLAERLSGFDYECSIENSLSLPVEIRYEDKPVTISRSRNAFNRTKVFFKLDKLVQHTDLTYYINNKQVEYTKVTSFSYKEYVPKPIWYRMELITNSFPGNIKLMINEKELYPATETQKFSGTYKTTIRFKNVAGLKKEDVQLLTATIAHKEYSALSHGFLLSDLIRIN